MKRITVIGAGNVGATLVYELVRRSLAEEVFIVDINEPVTHGKALDMWQTSPLHSFSTRVYGVGNDYSATAHSEIVVMTAGMARKPGMSRDDLVEINAKIMRDVAVNIKKYSPEAIVLVVTNPLDVMTYAAFIGTGFPRERVFGMAGVLDTARYRAFIAEVLDVAPRDIQAMLMGGHGDTMVPLPRYTTVGGIPIAELMPKEKLESIVERTKQGGKELVDLLGISAWYAPGASAAEMVEAIVKNEKRVLPVCAGLAGEYGLSGLHLGVPVILGAKGVEKVIELQLNAAEMELVRKSAEAVKKVMKQLDDMKIF
ncbi:MAG: malate dehydrogenase [Bacteroides sp.]